MKILGIITGAIMCILGVYAFFVPVRTFLGIGWAVGFLIAVHGIEMVIMALSGKKKEIWKCVFGVLVAILGFILLFSNLQRFLTDLMIAYLAGSAVVIYGIYQIVTGCMHIKEEKGNSILSIVIGVLSVICGIFLLNRPIFAMASLGYAIACAVLIQGVNMIVLAVRIGKEEK